MALELRKITETDYENCAKVLCAAFKNPPWNENWTITQATDRITEIMSSRVSRGYVIEKENEIVAILIGRIMTYLDYKELYIDELSVSPLAQGFGLGGMILEFAKTELVKEGIHHLILNTERASPAVKFYEKHGFKEVEHLLIMSSTFD